MATTEQIKSPALEEELAQLRLELEFEKGFSTAYTRGSDCFYVLNVSRGVIASPLSLKTEKGNANMLAYAGFGPGCSFDALFAALAELCVDESYRFPFVRSLSREYLLQKFQEGVHTIGFEYRRLENAPGAQYLRHEIQLARDPRSGEIFARGSVRDVTNRYAMSGSSVEADKSHTALLASLGKIYYQVFYIYLVNDIFVPLTTTDYVKSHLRASLSATAAFAEMAGSHEKPEYYDSLRAFQNLSTLPQRMAEKDYLSFEYDSSLGWIRAAFIVSERDQYGQIKSVIYTLQLIQEEKLKQLENEEHLAEALSMAQAANKAKTTFLNNMSHDIRTPMNAIIGYVGLAASHIDNKTQVQGYLSKIAQSSDHLLSLINDVLDMSRIESGKMNLSERQESLPEILHTLRNIIQSDINAKNQSLFIDCVDVHDETVYCDKLRLNQVLLNIISNSIKYTPAGGMVSLKITETAAAGNDYGTYTFCIRDNGMGMSKEFLATIYEPFTRVNSSTVSGIQGTGLGMAITRNIVDMMGGKIEIESEPGVGTETKVTLQFRLAKTHAKPEAIASLTGLRALVVDDDMDACRGVSGMLREAGMRSEWCVTGHEAVVRAEESVQIGDSFRVYILDWLMPDMNGIETARRIRHVIGDDTPIIILSAYDWSDVEEEAREAGVTGFISKPVFASELRKLLQQFCGEAPEEEISEPESYDFSGKKVLLVEDNEMNREIATEILSEAGLHVDTAEDGSIALRIVTDKGVDYYDYVLMDVQMPVMDGYEATRAIRALPGSEQLRIIAVSANAFDEDVQKSLASGMNAHVAKPISVPALFAAMQELA